MLLVSPVYPTLHDICNVAVDYWWTFHNIFVDVTNHLLSHNVRYMMGWVTSLFLTPYKRCWTVVIQYYCNGRNKIFDIYSTYISEKVEIVVQLIKSSILFTTYYLQYQNAKAENIRFHRKQSIHCIFRWHVTTAFSKKTK